MAIPYKARNKYIFKFSFLRNIFKLSSIKMPLLFQYLCLRKKTLLLGCVIKVIFILSNLSGETIRQQA